MSFSRRLFGGIIKPPEYVGYSVAHMTNGNSLTITPNEDVNVGDLLVVVFHYDTYPSGYNSWEDIAGWTTRFYSTNNTGQTLGVLYRLHDGSADYTFDLGYTSSAVDAAGLMMAFRWVTASAIRIGSNSYNSGASTLTAVANYTPQALGINVAVFTNSSNVTVSSAPSMTELAVSSNDVSIAAYYVDQATAIEARAITWSGSGRVYAIQFTVS